VILINKSLYNNKRAYDTKADESIRPTVLQNFNRKKPESSGNGNNVPYQSQSVSK